MSTVQNRAQMKESKCAKDIPKCANEMRCILYQRSFVFGPGFVIVKTLFNVTRYNRLFNIRHKFAWNGSVSIKIPSL